MIGERGEGDGGPGRPQGEARLNRLLNLILEAAVDSLEFDAATVTARVGSQMSTIAATDARLVALDDAQYAAAAGPSIDVLDGSEPLAVGDASCNERWGFFHETAIYLGIHTTLSLHLPIPDQDALSGSLNLYSHRLFELDEHQRRMAPTFAEQIAVTMQSVESNRSAARLAEQMAEAMSSRAVIEQAKGMLMSDHQIDQDEAFRRLAQASQRSNVKLRDVARALVGRRSGRADPSG